MQHQIQTEIDIDAPTETVWNVLTDLDDYHTWNPFIVSSEGRAQVGERLTNRMQTRGGKAMTFRPTVTAAKPGQIFEWLGHVGIPGIFDGRHRFELTERPSGGTHLEQTESFRGVLVRAMRKSLDDKTRDGFEMMNAALKTRAEAMATAS